MDREQRCTARVTCDRARVPHHHDELWRHPLDVAARHAVARAAVYERDDNVLGVPGGDPRVRGGEPGVAECGEPQEGGGARVDVERHGRGPRADGEGGRERVVQVHAVRASRVVESRPGCRA